MNLRHRFQAALLIEPQHNVMTQNSLINKIWLHVQQANVEGSGHAKILRFKIMITSPEKPFLQASKGTVVRGTTTKLYVSEIKSLYANRNTQLLSGDPILAAPYNLKACRQFVRACSTSFFLETNIIETDDFFALDLNFLQTVELVSEIKTDLRHHPKASDLSWLSTKTIYTNPTIFSLVKLIHSWLNSESTTETESSDLKEHCEARMNALVEEYTRDLPQKKKVRSISSMSKISVALTDFTGSLRSHLLRALLNDPNVFKVYCLNRSANAQKRHKRNFAEHSLDYGLGNPQVLVERGGIECSITGPKAEFIKADFGCPLFDLSARKFAELINDVNVIIHNA